MSSEPDGDAFDSSAMAAWYGRMSAVAQDLWSRRPDVREQCESIHALSFWAWVIKQGYVDHPEVRELLPCPPDDLVGRIRGVVDDAEYRDSSVAEAWQFYSLLTDAGFDFAAPGALLDFGCGSGRLLRVFSRFCDQIELHGADVDADAIAWCREHLPFAHWELNPVAPPTRFAPATFGAIYACSVFSHLPEELHLQWLAELARVTRPGGVLVLTIQGMHTAQRFARGDAFGFPFPSAETMRADLPGFEERGWLYYSYEHPIASIPTHSQEEDVQGMAFITEDYVRRVWTQFFDVVALHVAPQGWQDFVVLRGR